ncbi:MAG: hypothetical protein IJ688_03065 [Treponema sp.]|nr:hypothetical protein [Treponema sp.]
MKKYYVFFFCLFAGLFDLAAQIKWSQLQPMQELSQEEYLSLFTENYENLLGGIFEMSYKRVTVAFLNEEPVYDFPKAKSAGPRLVVCLEVKTADGLEFLKAVCADCYQNNVGSEIKHNQFGLCMQTRDLKGKNHLLYTGILVDDIGFYPLGNIVIGTGAYENTMECIYKEAPFYFWDSTSRKLMCFYSNGAELKKTNIRVENPMFAFSSDSKGQEFRDLYLMDLNPKTKEPLAGKSWLCSSCEFIKVE